MPRWILFGADIWNRTHQIFSGKVMYNSGNNCADNLNGKHDTWRNLDLRNNSDLKEYLYIDLVPSDNDLTLNWK